MMRGGHSNPVKANYNGSSETYMPQMTPIVLNDGIADTTFSPRGQDAQGVTTFVSSTGVPIADKRITVQRSRTANTGREKVSFKMTIPVVQDATVGGITSPSVVRTAFCDVTFTFDKASTEAERARVRVWLGDMMSEALTSALIDDLEYLF